MVKPQAASSPIQLPKKAFANARLGQSFAEHDLIRANPRLFVETPAIRAAQDPESGKIFFIGRRGTGKTAITFYLSSKYPRNTITLVPKLLSSADPFVSSQWDKRVHQKPFNTLVSSFERAILDEALAAWIKQGLFAFRSSTASEITRERNEIEQFEFDLRLLNLIEEGFEHLVGENTKEWIRFRNRPNKLAAEMSKECGAQTRMEQIVMVDRLDDEWDDSDNGVVLVMALMHACVEIRSWTHAVVPMVFLRENVFDRVRELDGEFSRLETSLVSLDWTKELLRELIERRLNEGLISKFAVDGSTWGMFFDGDPSESQSRVFSFCQYRPRDVLLYTSTALGLAQSHQRAKIEQTDLDEAKRSFSESRLKELADEYADNYPYLSTVLTRFFGLGVEYTIGGVEDFIKKILLDGEIQVSCGRWIYSHTTPDLLIQLLYNIGFCGVKQAGGAARFKSSEAENTGTLSISPDSIVVVHPSYVDGLQLQPMVITSLSDSVQLRTSGLIVEVPESFSTASYRKRLEELHEELATLPTGRENARKFEDIVGEVIKLCFFKSLSNVQPRARNDNNTVIRDWVASNRAAGGFWEIVRQKYNATQVVWECKNYASLESEDFQQVSYYMNDQAGRFAIMVCRSEAPLSAHVQEHVRRVYNQTRGLVLVLRESDTKTFLRQAINGKKSGSEQHLQDLFDRNERLIS